MDKFKCTRCNTEFIKGQTDEEAISEFLATDWPCDVELSTSDIVCDKCYKELMKFYDITIPGKRN